MTRGRARIHLDASEPGKPRRALCGWTFVDTATDLTAVTCKACLSCLQRGRARSAKSVDHELSALLVPKAGPPPKFTPQLWATICRDRRCNVCDLCVWERQVELWNHVAPWTDGTRAGVSLQLPGPRWPSLAAALRAYAEWIVHQQQLPSALGGLIDRAKRGAALGGSGVQHDSAPVRSVDDVDSVRRALEAAYPDNPIGVQLLLLRTDGVAEVLTGRPGARTPLYEALAERMGMTAHQVQLLVVSGRQKVTGELVRRGVIPVPRERARSERGLPCLRS